MKIPKWLLFVLLAAIVVLLVQVNCNFPKTPVVNKYEDSIATLTAKIAETNKRHYIKTVAEERAKDSMKAIIMVLEDRLQASTADFEKEGKKAVEYNRLYKLAKNNRDTLMIFENCDSMSVKVDAAEQKYAVVERQNDSLKGELVVAESTYQVAVSSCRIDYDTLKAQTERKDVLQVKQNAATLALVKKQKRRSVWDFLKGVGLGFLLDEIRHLFIK